MPKLGTLLRKAGYVCACAALASLVLSPCFAAAETGAVGVSDKSETVHVHLDADGAVTSTKISSTLKNVSSAQQLVDLTDVKDVEVSDSDIAYTETGGSIIWQADGRDVSYTGTIDKSTPVTMSVSYKLDGKDVSGSELAGATGEVAIRYDYKNNSSKTVSIDGETETIYTPFACITTLMIDDELFDDIQVTNGKVLEDAEETVIIGYALPGLKESLGEAADDAKIPEYFEVKANVHDFELKSSMTVVTAGLFEDIDTDDFGLADADETTEEITDAFASLTSGSSALTDGIIALQSGARSVSAGAHEVESGTYAISGAIATSQTASSQIVDNLHDSNEGLKVILEGEEKDDDKKAEDASASSEDPKVNTDGLKGVSAQISEASSMLSPYATMSAEPLSNSDQIAAVQESLNSLRGSLDAMIASTEDDETIASLQALQAQVDSTESLLYVAEVQGDSTPDETLAAVAALIIPASVELEAEVEGLEDISKSNQKIREGASQLSQGLGNISYQSNNVAYGAEQVADGSYYLSESASELAAGTQALTESLNRLAHEGIEAVSDAIEGKMGTTLDRINALSDAANEYKSFSGRNGIANGSVKFIYEVDAIAAE